MTDLTDRLARVVELCERASPGAWGIDPRPFHKHGMFHLGNGQHVVATAMGETSSCETEAAANAEAIGAAVNFIRDDAPALLAEVAALNARIATLRETADRATARADDAEKVAREAVWLLREADTYVRALAALDGGVPRTIDPNSVSGRISALLAHHGAGTGEGG